MEAEILKLVNVNKYYVSETNITQALRGVSLSLSMGEFVAVTGESGSGKSTLLNVLSGTDPYDDGEMFFNGDVTSQYTDRDWEEYRKDRIGFVYQDYQLIEHYTVLDNILAAAYIQGEGKEAARERAEECLRLVGLDALSGRRASDLSSGQKQRLSIARAVAKATDMIVADEPTGNLDLENSMGIIKILKKLSEERLVVMVTHDADQVMGYATRELVLHDGAVVLDHILQMDKAVLQKNNADPAPGTGADRPSDIHNYSDKKDASGKASAAGVEENQENRVGADTDKVLKRSVNREKNHRCTEREIRFFAWRNILTQRGRTVFFLAVLGIVSLASFLFIGELSFYSDDRIARKYNSDYFTRKEDDRLLVSRKDGEGIAADELQMIKSLKHVRAADFYGYANEVIYSVKSVKDVLKEKKTAECVKSVTVIEKEDMVSGKLPVKRNEILVSQGYQKKAGDRISCHFRSKRNWGKQEVYSAVFQVTGVVKGDGKQIYFAPEFCEMISVPAHKKLFLLKYAYKLEEDYTNKKGYNGNKDGYVGKFYMLPVISDGLKGNDVRVSEQYVLPAEVQIKLKKGFEPVTMDDAFAKSGPGLIRMQGREDVQVNFLLEYHQNGAPFLEVSRELYQKLYGEEMDGRSSELSVYLTDYKRTDQVLEHLGELGYEAVSTYRVSTAEYDRRRAEERLQIMGISVLVLVLVFGMQLLIVPLFLRIKGQCYRLLHSLGMARGDIYRIIFHELMLLELFALAVGSLAGIFMGMAGVPGYSRVILDYSGAWAVLLAAYNLLCAVSSAVMFMRISLRRAWE